MSQSATIPTQFEVRHPSRSYELRSHGLIFRNGVARTDDAAKAHECVRAGLAVKNLSTGIEVKLPPATAVDTRGRPAPEIWPGDRERAERFAEEERRRRKRRRR